MGKPFVLKNKRSLEGQATTPVLITIKSWQKLVEAFEGKYYSYTDTYLEDIINHMSYEERIADEDNFVEQAKPSFSLLSGRTYIRNNERKHKLYGITNADLEVFIFLHKKCNTFGVLSHVSIHMLWEEYKKYKEELAFIQHSQFYIALKKLCIHNIVSIQKELSGKCTIKLTHFMNDETKKSNPYTFINPVVFTKQFFSLSIAAKKLFLDVAMQQKRETTLKRSLFKQDENGNSTHFGGMYRFLHKKYPHQIREVMNELTQTFPCTGAPLFKICKLEKGKKNVRTYTTMYLSIHSDFLCDREAGEEYRDPITPRVGYARKARFIEGVLNELNIGEFVQDMNYFINILKYTCHRQIRQVLRGLRDMIHREEEYPSNLVYTLKKLLIQSASYRVQDAAAKAGIYSLITHNVAKEQQEQAIFDFAKHYSTYSLHTVKKLFNKAYELLHSEYTVPVTEEIYQKHHLKYQEESLFRKYAFEQGVNVNTYLALELEIRELLKARGHKMGPIPSDVREMFIERIDKLPQEQIRVIEVPDNFSLIDFINTIEEYTHNGREAFAASEIMQAI